MTTEQPWAHLPNAAHIEAVLKSIQEKPEVWAKHREVQFEAKHKALAYAMDEVWRRDLIREYGALPPEWREAVLALVVWEEAAELLDLSSGELLELTYEAYTPVCHQAALLIPYARVREIAREEARARSDVREVPRALWEDMNLALDQALARIEVLETDPGVVTRRVYEFGQQVLARARRGEQA